MTRFVSQMLAGLMSMVLLAGVCLAQDSAAPKPLRPNRQAAASRPKVDGIARQLLDAKELGLTDDQRKQIETIVEAQRQAVANWQKENGQQLVDLQKKVAAARETGDKEQIKPLAAELKKLTQSRAALAENLTKQLSDVLSAEQFTKAKEILDALQKVIRPLAVIEQLNQTDQRLTEAQMKQVKEIMDAARTETGPATGALTPKVLREAFEKIRKDVLTDAQRKKLEELLARDKAADGAPAEFGTLDMTDAQKASMQDILQQARKDAAPAEGADAKKAVIDAARKKIVDEVLTPEQRTKLEQWKKDHPEIAPAIRERVRERVQNARGAKATTQP